MPPHRYRLNRVDAFAVEADQRAMHATLREAASEMTMFEELVLLVEGSGSTVVPATELAGLDLKEREHVQGWVLRHPPNRSWPYCQDHVRPLRRAMT